MDIQTSKLELVKMIVNINNQEIIDKIYNALKPETNDFWLNLTESEKREIKLGISQLDTGKRTSLDKFLEKVS